MDAILRTITAYLHRIATYNPLVVAIELMLIGVVIWWVMRFLRGTRGARLVKGFAVLLASVYIVIRMLPESLDWDRIRFLYGNFLLFAFVSVVVAFQPELRRALIQIGQTSFFRSPRGSVEKLIDELVESATYFSRNKIGAIAAIERSAGLATLTESGTILDAEFSSSLLNTIFYPANPLHDMGVVIRHGRIAAAGCQFPLAESEDADPSLGSRHRAALGLAQECDAVVFVVSEETGRISLACDGQLYLGLDLEGLKEMLTALLVPAKPLRRRHKAKNKANA